MALQILLYHPLGKQTFTLEPRSADHPLVVGRANTADVLVPSTKVGRQHCILFVQNGRWMIQDAGTRQGTFLNGKSITVATPLKPGDVIILGDDPKGPRIAIKADTSEKVVSRKAPSSRPSTPFDLSSPPKLQVGPTIEETADAVDSAQWEGSSDSVEILPSDFSGLAVAGSESLGRLASEKEGLSGAITIGIITLVAVLLAGAGYMIYSVIHRNTELERQARNPVTIIETNVPVDPASKELSLNLATQPSWLDAPPVLPATAPIIATTTNIIQPSPASLPVETAPTAPVAAENANVENPSPESAADPAREEPAWKRVEQARVSDPPQLALYIYQKYRADFPTTPFAGKLAEYTEESLDTLWWQRVKELCDQRNLLQQQSDELTGSINSAKGGNAKASLVLEQKNIRKKQAILVEILRKEMAYTSSQSPDIYDSFQIDELRKSRDAAIYAAWKKTVLESIKANRGSLPWKTESK